MAKQKCHCGCQQPLRSKRKFLPGHNQYNRKILGNDTKPQVEKYKRSALQVYPPPGTVRKFEPLSGEENK